MTRSRPADLSALLSTAVEQALRAPSVHNTQAVIGLFFFAAYE